VEFIADKEWDIKGYVFHLNSTAISFYGLQKALIFLENDLLKVVILIFHQRNHSKVNFYKYMDSLIR